MLSLALQPDRLQWLNHPMLRYLGQISYGIYMFNLLGCVLAMNVIQRLGRGTFVFFETSPLLADMLYYALCLTFTIALSSLSYRFLEAPFLRLKDRVAQPSARAQAA